jgi:hypothetical protein
VSEIQFIFGKAGFALVYYRAIKFKRFQTLSVTKIFMEYTSPTVHSSFGNELDASQTIMLF